MFPILPHRFFEGGALPDAFMADGMRVALKTDFRAWLKYEFLKKHDALEGLTNAEQVDILARLCLRDFGQFYQISADTLFDAIVWFHSCAEVERLSRIRITQLMQDTMNRQPVRSDLFWDFKALWDSFRQQYDIDLYSCGEIHWWEFKRMIDSLKTETPYGYLRYMRGVTSAEFKGDEKAQKQERERLWGLLECERAYAELPERW